MCKLSKTGILRIIAWIVGVAVVCVTHEYITYWLGPIGAVVMLVWLVLCIAGIVVIASNPYRRNK